MLRPSVASNLNEKKKKTLGQQYTNKAVRVPLLEPLWQTICVKPTHIMRSTFSLVYALIQTLIIRDLTVALDAQGYSDTSLCLKL